MERSDQEEAKQASYAAGLNALNDAKVPYLVGGGWALHAYLGPWRATKDIDVFVTAAQVERALAVLANAGFQVELTDATWLAKAFFDGALIDIIFCSYNGFLPVDASWHDHSREAVVLGVPVRVIGLEEMIASKCFVAARDRFDGGDVASLFLALGPTLDWARLEYMMRDHWQVLLWQLIHFLYVHPAATRAVPGWLVSRLMAKQRRELAAGGEKAAESRGRMLDPKLYRELEVNPLMRRAGG